MKKELKYCYNEVVELLLLKCYLLFGVFLLVCEIGENKIENENGKYVKETTTLPKSSRRPPMGLQLFPVSQAKITSLAEKTK